MATLTELLTLDVGALLDRVCAFDADDRAALLPQRMEPEALASAMATMAPAVPLNRWADSLGDLSVAGLGAQVRALLTALLPSLDRTVRGLHTLVELLRDEHLRAAVPVTEPALRRWLSATGGRSKTTAAARTLLGHLDPGRHPDAADGAPMDLHRSR